MLFTFKIQLLEPSCSDNKNLKELCVVMSVSVNGHYKSGDYNDVICSIPYRFICQYRKKEIIIDSLKNYLNFI